MEPRLLLYSATGNAWPNPQTVTISFMPDGTNLGSATSNLQATFNANPNLVGRWQGQILQAAQLWAQQTNLNFVVVPDDGAPSGSGPDQQGDPNHGDIRIGGYNFGTATLARANQPPPVNNFSIAGDINFNTGEAFNIGTTYDLSTVATHEIGHALGLDHTSVSSSPLEYATYTGRKPLLTADDIAGIRSIYSAGGARATDVFAGANVSRATAANLNTRIGAGPTALVPDLNIATAGQAETFTFTAPSGASGPLVVSVQSSGLSLLVPKLTVGTASGTILGTAVGTGPTGSTISVTVPNVAPNQQFYIQVLGADASAFGTGRFALGLGFNGQPAPTEASPIVPYASGAVYTSGGGLAYIIASSDDYSIGAPTITGVGAQGAASLSLQGTAPAGETVRVYQDGVLAGTATADDSNTWTFALTDPAVAAGSHAFTADAIDPAGNVTPLSSPYAVTVAPRATSAFAVDGLSAFSSIAPAVAVGATGDQTISGTADSGSTINLYTPGIAHPIATATAQVQAHVHGHGHAHGHGQARWSVTVPQGTLAQGAYRVVATSTNAAGSATIVSRPFILTVSHSGAAHLAGARRPVRH